MGKRFLPIFCVVFFFLAVSLLLTYSWLHNWFGSMSVQSVMTYLNLPRTEIETAYLVDYFCSMLVVIPLTLLFGIAIHVLFRNGGIAGIPVHIFAFVISSTLLFLLLELFVRIERKHELLDYMESRSEISTYFDNAFREVPPCRITFPGKKRNLLLLALESVEESLADPALFGENIIPRLTALQADSVHFTQWIPTEGTLFSMAAFTSFLYGAPLIIYDPPRLDEPSRPFVFRPKVPSILGIMEDNGYDVSFVLGSDSKHNSMNTLIESGTKHGLLADRDYFLKHDPAAADQLHLWGLPDTYLYARAKELLTQKSADAQPFACIILTVNTHIPGVTEPGLPAPFGDARDSFLQADILATQFIDWARRQPWADDTTIIVMGDHPNEQPVVGTVALPEDRTKRRVFNLFLNLPPELPTGNTRKMVATWDMAPTLLESIGATIPEGKFGLGTSFFSPERTLLELVGVKRHNSLIKRKSKLYGDLFIGKEEPVRRQE